MIKWVLIFEFTNKQTKHEVLKKVEKGMVWDKILESPIFKTCDLISENRNFLPRNFGIKIALKDKVNTLCCDRS